MSNWEADSVDKKAAPYRHPHSFYFSGFPGTPPNAPILSQNYTEFSMKKPDPKKTWDLVSKFAAGKPIPKCNLFNQASKSLTSDSIHPTWDGKIK